MHAYSYAACLENAYKVNWRIEDVLADRRFDPSKRWMPPSLSAAGAVTCLDEAGKRALTQIELAAYAHLFGYVEEFIAPKVSTLAHDFELENRSAFDALTNFAAEEVKHMNLFRALRGRTNAQLGFELELLAGETSTARFVLGKSTAAALLFISALEWMTQGHYLDAIKDDSGLDPFTKVIFKAHWVEESQHAQLDHLETVRAFEGLSPAERERAFDEVIEILRAVDGLLRQQTGHDLANLARLLRRTFNARETAELEREILRAKRWTFVLSGVMHPRFDELFRSLATPLQQQRVGTAIEELFAVGPVVSC